MTEHQNLSRRWTITAVAIIIVLIGWAFRTIALGTLPPGIDRDVATNGVYSLYILFEGLRPLFYHVGAPEPLIIYLQAASIAFLGVNVFALRIVTAVISALTIPALYIFSRGLKIDWRVALAAAFGLAISIMHAHLSRLGFRATLIPLVEMLLLYFFWRALRDGRRRDFAIAGIVLGVSYYTYLSAIFLPVLLAALLAHQFVFDRARLVVRWRGVAITAVIGLAVAAPLAIFEIIYPGAALFRASQVTLLQNPAVQQIGLLGALALKLVSQAKMFGIEWQGQYNPLSIPLLDPVWFTFFLLGLAICLRRARRFEYAWALIALVVMLLPDVIGGNEVFPQEYRVIGVIPPAFFVCAVGLVAAIDWAARWQPRVAYLIAGALLLWSGVNGVDAYLIRWNNLAQTTDDANFNHAEVAEGKWIAQTNAPVYLPLNEYGRQPVRYLIGKRAPYLRAATDADVRAAQSAWIVFPTDNARPRFEGRVYAHDPAAFALVSGDTVHVLSPAQDDVESKLGRVPSQEIRDEIGQVVARAYYVDAARYFVFAAPRSNNDVRFSSGVELIDSSLDAQRVQPGGSIPLSAWWRAAQHLSDDYTIFVHLLDVDGNVVTTADVIPALGAYPTFLWKPGEIVPTHHPIRVPARTPPGKYLVEIGLYNTLNQVRLDVLDARGNALDSRVIVGAVKVAPREPLAYNPTHAQRANFDQQIALEGYDTSATAQPGSALKIALGWRALKEMDQDYTVFVHLLDANDRIVAQADHQPQAGRYPTSIWDAGEVVRDDFTLNLPDNLPNGEYKIRIGWYDLKTGARLPVRDANNQPIGDNVILDAPLAVSH